MSSKILLVNFSKKESEKIMALNLLVDRGYFSDIKRLTKQEAIGNLYDDEKQKENGLAPLDNIQFYFPLPIYEYKAVFINLNNNNNLEDEFKDKKIKLTNDDRKTFTQFWLSHGKPMVIFLGDYDFNNLDNLGIPDISLQKVANRDVSINSSDGNNLSEMSSLFKEFKSSVTMPTNYYVCVAEKGLFAKENSSYKYKDLLWNNNNKNLAIFINYSNGYSSKNNPKILILPQFNKNIQVVERFLKELAKLSPKYLPELPQSDWIDSNEYYPSEITNYDNQIDQIIDAAQLKINSLKRKKEEAKQRYKNLRGLLTESGDTLKDCVIDILKNIFKLKVEDGDMLPGLQNEDIIIHNEEEKILAEIKGVKSENPSPAFLGQVWKHIAHNGDKNIIRGALILNHHLEANPIDRNLAYKGEHEKELEDIVFIDTRIMFNLGIAIIDYGMTSEDAIKILLKTGRVNFDLNEYAKSYFEKNKK